MSTRAITINDLPEAKVRLPRDTRVVPPGGQEVLRVLTETLEKRDAAIGRAGNLLGQMRRQAEEYNAEVGRIAALEATAATYRLAYDVLSGRKEATTEALDATDGPEVHEDPAELLPVSGERRFGTTVSSRPSRTPDGGEGLGGMVEGGRPDA